MNFYPFHIGDYTLHTAHLSPLEDIAYRRLLDLYYTTERPITLDSDRAARLVRMDEYKQAVIDVLGEFFLKTDEGYVSKRAEAEISKYGDIVAERSKAGKASAAQRALKKSTHVEQVLSTCATNRQQNPTNQDHDQDQDQSKPKTSSSSAAPSDVVPAGFAEFWSAYPRKVGKGAAMKLWSRLKVNGHLPKVLAAIEAQKRSEQWKRDGGQFIPYPATWLGQGRWDDDVDTVARAASVGINPRNVL